MTVWCRWHANDTFYPEGRDMVATHEVDGVPVCGLCYSDHIAALQSPASEDTMGHHLTPDDPPRFQSDLHPELDPDKIVLSFNDPLAHRALHMLARAYHDKDPGLAEDILQVLQGKGFDFMPEKPPPAPWQAARDKVDEAIARGGHDPEAALQWAQVYRILRYGR